MGLHLARRQCVGIDCHLIKQAREEVLADSEGIVIFTGTEVHRVSGIGRISDLPAGHPRAVHVKPRIRAIISEDQVSPLIINDGGTGKNSKRGAVAYVEVPGISADTGEGEKRVALKSSVIPR